MGKKADESFLGAGWQAGGSFESTQEGAQSESPVCGDEERIPGIYLT